MDIDYYKDREKPTHPICTAGLMVKNNKILMGLREYEKGKAVWVLPGGRCNPGEQLEHGFRREVLEEIGIKNINIKGVIGEKEGVWKGGPVPDIVYFFSCTTDQEPQLLEPEKFLDWKWFALNEIPDNYIDLQDFKFIKQVIN